MTEPRGWGISHEEIQSARLKNLDDHKYVLQVSKSGNLVEVFRTDRQDMKDFLEGEARKYISYEKRKDPSASFTTQWVETEKNLPFHRKSW